MKKKISVLLSLIMIVGVLMGGCGSKMETAIGTETEANEIEKESVETVMEETASIEVMTEETQEAAETTEDTLQTEEETTSVETQEAIDTSAEDINKILRLIEAYNLLIEHDENFAFNLQDNIEYMIYTCEGMGMTADGKTLKNNVTGYAIIIHYYDEFVNNNGTYYDFNEWMKEQPSSDYIYETYCPGGIKTPNTTGMFEAIRLANYLSSLEEISLGEKKETDEYIMTSGETSAYTYPLICDGEDVGLTAIYDENGKLLNINSSNNFSLYIPTYVREE